MKRREYHFISDNHVVLFVRHIINEIEEHPKKDIDEIIREDLKHDFGNVYYVYKEKEK